MGTRTRFGGVWTALAMAGTAAGQVTSRASVSSAGVQGDLHSVQASISADGRYVAFASQATNLVAGDTNSWTDVFVRDRQLGATERVSVDSAGVEGESDSFKPSISADGRYVAFVSTSTNLVAGDTNGYWDIFVRDRQAGTTERVSVDSAGTEGNNDSGQNGGQISNSVSISADGRYVAFISFANNLAPGDTNFYWDVFVRDRLAGTTERVSVDSAGAQGTYGGGNYGLSISADGRYVAFASGSTLVAGDTNHAWDIFVRDRQTGTTERVSVDSSGVEGNNQSGYPSISGDGRYVAFASTATNLVAGDTNTKQDIFVRDRQAGTTVRVSVDSAGTQGDQDSTYPVISADGRTVAFRSAAANLVALDTNAVEDVFVHDLLTGATERASVATDGTEGNGAPNFFPAISADGRSVAFQSLASNHVTGDTNGSLDVFVRDRTVPFWSLCDPGTSGVIACPCANPPSGPGRGCNNSSGTGGAMLSAAGDAQLASDTLSFTTSGQKPSTASVLVQGTAALAGGVVYGQGVRCVGGTLQRLYTQGATGGAITVPGAADPPVSARSAALGDTIQAGQSRWYLVLYRDGVVLGGCPATSSFNATQTLEVAWAP